MKAPFFLKILELFGWSCIIPLSFESLNFPLNYHQQNLALFQPFLICWNFYRRRACGCLGVCVYMCVCMCVHVCVFRRLCSLKYWRLFVRQGFCLWVANCEFILVLIEKAMIQTKVASVCVSVCVCVCVLCMNFDAWRNV